MGLWNPDTSGFRMVKKRLVCKCSGFQMGSEVWKPDHLKNGQLATILSKTIWNLDKIVLILNVPVFKLSRPLALAIAWHFKPSIWNLIFKKSRFQMFSDFEWSNFRSPLLALLTFTFLKVQLGPDLSNGKSVSGWPMFGFQALIWISDSFPFEYQTKKQLVLGLWVICAISDFGELDHLGSRFSYRYNLKIER